MSLLVPLLIPIDTTLTAAFPHLTFMQGIWEWLLAIIAAMSLIVIPFALFYFDERMLNNRTCSNALGCSLIQTGVLAFVILALGFGLSFAVGFAYIPINRFSSPGGAEYLVMGLEHALE